MRWVVVDEADLLMTGGYQRDMRKILGSMQEGDRAGRMHSICGELGIGVGTFQGLPRHLQKQALEGDVFFICIWSFERGTGLTV